MCPNRGNDGDRVDVCCSQQIVRIGSCTQPRICLLNSSECLFAFVTYGHHARTFSTLKVTNNVGPPISVANHTDPDHFLSFLLRRKAVCDVLVKPGTASAKISRRLNYFEMAAMR